MTHADLVCQAERWLRNGFKVLPSYQQNPSKHRCGVVLSKACIVTNEQPDAIGWFLCGRRSCLVECKTSRADFLADGRKPFRLHSSLGMGQFRYYMAPPGIIRVDEVPDKWGLVEVNNGRCYVALIAQEFQEFAWREEKVLMWSALKRTQEKEEGGGK